MCKSMLEAIMRFVPKAQRSIWHSISLCGMNEWISKIYSVIATNNKIHLVRYDLCLHKVKVGIWNTYLCKSGQIKYYLDFYLKTF